MLSPSLFLFWLLCCPQAGIFLSSYLITHSYSLLILYFTHWLLHLQTFCIEIIFYNFYILNYSFQLCIIFLISLSLLRSLAAAFRWELHLLFLLYFLWLSQVLYRYICFMLLNISCNRILKLLLFIFTIQQASCWKSLLYSLKWYYYSRFCFLFL